MKLTQLIRTLIFALALLILGISHLLGDDPEQPSAVPDQEVAIEEVGSQDVGVWEDFTADLPSVSTEELPSASTEVEVSSVEPGTIAQSSEILPEAAGSETDPYAGITPTNQAAAYPEYIPAEVASEPLPGSLEANNADVATTDCLSNDAPYPDITEFPVPPAAFHVDPSAVREAELASSWEEDAPLDTVTPAEYTADCNWLVEKLDGYRNVQPGAEPQRFQEASPLVEVPQTPLGCEYPATPDVPKTPLEEVPQYTEVPSVEWTGTLPLNQDPVQDAVVIASEPPLTEEVQQASATSLGQLIEPSILTPPATIVPKSPLNQVLDERTLAAVYGVFVGVLATLFLLLLGLIVRSLVNRIMPRPAAVGVGASTPNTLQDPPAPPQQPLAATQPPTAIPPHAQYVAYPQQQAYMAPFMMHPSFVYADVDPREQDRPRRPKSSKPKTKRKRRTAPASKRSTRRKYSTQPRPQAETGQESGSGSKVQSFELDAFDKGKKNTDAEPPIQPGVYTKILEQNLQLRNKGGA